MQCLKSRRVCSKSRAPDFPVDRGRGARRARSCMPRRRGGVRGEPTASLRADDLPSRWHNTAEAGSARVSHEVQHARVLHITSYPETEAYKRLILTPLLRQKSATSTFSPGRHTVKLRLAFGNREDRSKTRSDSYSKVKQR